MSIETFIQEIETRKRKEIESLEKDLQESKSRLQAEMNHTLKEIQERFSTEAKVKSEREHARIIEASKLQAKKKQDRHVFAEKSGTSADLVITAR